MGKDLCYAALRLVNKDITTYGRIRDPFFFAPPQKIAYETPLHRLTGDGGCAEPCLLQSHLHLL